MHEIIKKNIYGHTITVSTTGTHVISQGLFNAMIIKKGSGKKNTFRYQSSEEKDVTELDDMETQ